jgi:hypothetical protein
MKFLLLALVALPVLVAAVVFGRQLTRCHQNAAALPTAESAEKSECCPSEKSECCPLVDKSGALHQTRLQSDDPDKQLVFQVEGLRCPAVKGIGCGHMLSPVLASLDRIDGVEASSTNYTGTLIRVSVTTAADRNKVAQAARKVLGDNEPVALAGDELKTALAKEQWRQAGRVGELSAIEFRTIALYRIKTFARAEKLDKETTDKLLKMVGDLWESLAQEAKKDRATQPEDWGKRGKKQLPVFLARAKEVLSAEQVERLKNTLMTPCRDADRPEAPAAP